jgi:hypothetical protein
LLDHVFMFIHYFIDTFFRSSDPSFSWFITKCLFYGCAQVTIHDDERLTFDLRRGLITRKRRKWRKPTMFGVFLSSPENRRLTSLEICRRGLGYLMACNYRRVLPIRPRNILFKGSRCDERSFLASKLIVLSLQLPHFSPANRINYPWIRSFRDINQLLQRESDSLCFASGFCFPHSHLKPIKYLPKTRPRMKNVANLKNEC